MSDQPASTRRDPRYELRSGAASIEFDDPTSAGSRLFLPLTRISTAGLAFEIGADGPDLRDGTLLESVTIVVAGCQLRGDALVRSQGCTVKDSVEVGCLFYPATSELAERLMALLAGIEAAQRD